MEKTLSILLGGDAMLGRGVNDTLQEVSPEYPLLSLQDITQNADLFFTNLECAISPGHRVFSGPAKTFYFRADPVAAECLAVAGVDLVSLANNHALDADYQGLLDTFGILEGRDIAYVGAGEDVNAASEPLILRRNGMEIGVLGYCDHQMEFAADTETPGIRYIDISDSDQVKTMENEVNSLAADVDHVVVSLHWQPNWVPEISDRYRALARRLVTAGASVLWGHSPHHFQGVEWIGQSIVIYSSGGLIDDYAVDLTFRNDRQILFEVRLGPNTVHAVWGYPLQLEFARTQQAGKEVRDWIADRFRDYCREVGSHVEMRGEKMKVLRNHEEQREW